MPVPILKVALLCSVLFSQSASTRRISTSNATPNDNSSSETCNACNNDSMAATAERGGFRGTLSSIVIPTFCVLGVFGNLIILLVWSSASDFNATVFFMKGLAVTDTVFLVITFIYCFADGREGTVETVIIFCFQLYSSVVNTTTTLVLVFTRWVAVHRPMEITALLPKRRVGLMYVVVQFWGVVATSAAVSLNTAAVYFTVNAVGVALPVFFTVCLNVSLVRKVCVHRANSTLGQQQQSAQAARSSQLHRMVAAVVCLSVTTVLAHPVALAAYLVHFLEADTSYDLRSIVHLLQAVNSSINVVFYLVFASHFRQLFRHRVRCLRCLQDQPYATSTT